MKDSLKNNLISEDFETDGTVLESYNGKSADVVIPNFITEVVAAEDRYGGCYSAFASDCIKSITVPKSLTYIDGLTFYMCCNLEKITVDEQNEAYYGEGNCIIERSGKTLVTVCKNSLIPQDIKYVADHALVNSYGKANLNYKGTKRQWGAIEKHADWNKSNRDCIVRCSDGDFTVDDAPFIVKGACLWAYRGHSAKVVIPEGITRVLSDAYEMDYCFDYCDFVKSITVPESLVNIGGHTFSGCCELEEIIVDSQNPKYYSQGNCVIERASKKLVAGCNSSIIPDDVKIIGFNAFSGYKNLTEIAIPNSVTSIEFGAFSDCMGLTGITVPDGVKSIADFTFNNCSSLSYITLPDGVTTIGYHAFHGCGSLKSVYCKGAATDWIGAMAEGNGELASATIYYYSALPPTKSGNYWHYDTDGVTPVKW